MLRKYSEVGAYPIAYYKGPEILCPGCARIDVTVHDERITGATVIWEEVIPCDVCHEPLETAYNEPEKEIIIQVTDNGTTSSCYLQDFDTVEGVVGATYLKYIVYVRPLDYDSLPVTEILQQYDPHYGPVLVTLDEIRALAYGTK